MRWANRAGTAAEPSSPVASRVSVVQEYSAVTEPWSEYLALTMEPIATAVRWIAIEAQSENITCRPTGPSRGLASRRGRPESPWAQSS